MTRSGVARSGLARLGGRPFRIAALAASAAVMVGAVSGCGSFSLYGVPLPGGASLGSNPKTVTVQLRDALDLVPQASVKVNNVSVGEVTSIDLDPKTWYADVRISINNAVPLPANAIAQLKQTTLLGEKYIELDRPTDVPAEGTLVSGAVIPVERTNRYPEAEEIFGALSMLLNGGGVGQLQSISHELNQALAGHESDARALLDNLNTLTTTLDGQRGNITRALDGVDRLSATLVDQRANLDKVLTDLQPGLAVLNQQRPQLVGMLRALDRLSDVANDVEHRSRDDLIADLRALEPTLRELDRSGNALPNSLQILASPPFTDSAVGAVRGDFMNLNIKLDLNIQDLLNNLLNATTPPVSLPANPLSTVPLPAPLSGLLTLPQLNQPNKAGATDKPEKTDNAGKSDKSGSSKPPLSGLLPGLGGN